jgi:cold shock CspA family protein
MRGKVKMFNAERHFGFIRTDGNADGIFFHGNSIIGDFEPANGDRVTFVVQPSKRKPGSSEAIEVRLVSDDEPDGMSLASVFADR